MTIEREERVPGKLAGKVALITGGSSGIGEAVALRFAAEGAKVAVVASAQLAKAEDVVARIAKAGGTAHAFVADVRSAGAANDLVRKAKDAFGRIDILVNSAGVFYATPVGATAEADLDRMIDTNLKGTLHMINAVAPGMKEQQGGKIINLASVAGVVGVGQFSAYTATKAAIIMLTRSVAIELAKSGINVNAIAPGNTATPMNADIRTKPEMKPVYDFMASRTPSARVYSPPEEMAGAILFLASDDAKAMHGSTLLADEGVAAGL